MKSTIILSSLLLALVLVVGCDATPDGPGTNRHADQAFYDFAWKRRPMVLFAPSLEDPRLAKQITIMKADKPGFAERDLTLIRAIGEDAEIVFPNEEKLRSGSGTSLRGRFGVERDEFAVVVIGKDGKAKHRWSKPVDAETLFRAIEDR